MAAGTIPRIGWRAILQAFPRWRWAFQTFTRKTPKDMPGVQVIHPVAPIDRRPLSSGLTYPPPDVEIAIQLPTGARAIRNRRSTGLDRESARGPQQLTPFALGRSDSRPQPAERSRSHPRKPMQSGSAGISQGSAPVRVVREWWPKAPPGGFGPIKTKGGRRLICPLGQRAWPIIGSAGGPEMTAVAPATGALPAASRRFLHNGHSHAGRSGHSGQSCRRPPGGPGEG